MSIQRRFHRRSCRIKNYDYSQNGHYFVTLCIKNRHQYFGEIINGLMKYSDLGKIVVQCWLDIPKHYPDVILDEFVVMPDHIHGIIQIKRRHVGAQTPIVGAQNFVPLQRVNRFHKIIPGSIGSIIRGFKIGVTKWCNANGYEFFRWQKNYYLAIIFDDSALLRVRKYILDNFKNWKSKN